jgi:predicted lipoprotein with Yx(FWY)xxD motif
MNGDFDMRNRWWAAPGAVAAVAFLAACGSSGSSTGASGSSNSTPAASASSPAASASAAAAPAGKPSTSASGITTAKTSKGTVLVTAQGFTIYQFAIDTSTMSKCYGKCATFWPPVIGKPTMAATSNLTGKFGTIKRTNGQLQATYNGRPLYLFAGDTKPGQVNGNGVNTSGGLWYAETPTGAKLTAATTPAAPAAPASSAATTSGSSGGYGY